MEATTPKFLWQLQVLLSENPDYIRWDEDGKNFTIIDEAGFTKNVLGRYFKHKQFSSFVRQLNMYGFKKVMGVHNTDYSSYYHPCFERDNYELMEKIKRKTSVNDKISNEVVNSITQQVENLQLSNAQFVEEVQHYRQENEALKKQVKIHQEKINQHEAYLQKMLNLLVYFKNVYPKLVRTEDLTTNQPLMIASNESQQNKQLSPKLVSPGSSEKLQNFSLESNFVSPLQIDRSFHTDLDNVKNFMQQDSNVLNSLVGLDNSSLGKNNNLLALSTQPHNFEKELLNSTRRKRPKLTPVRFLKPDPNRKVDRILTFPSIQTNFVDGEKQESTYKDDPFVVSSVGSLPNLDSLNDEIINSTINVNNNAAYLDEFNYNSNKTTNSDHHNLDMDTNLLLSNTDDDKNNFFGYTENLLQDDFPLNSNENYEGDAISSTFDQLIKPSTSYTQPSHNSKNK